MHERAAVMQTGGLRVSWPVVTAGVATMTQLRGGGRAGRQVPPEQGMHRYSRTGRGSASVDFTEHNGDGLVSWFPPLDLPTGGNLLCRYQRHV